MEQEIRNAKLLFIFFVIGISLLFAYSLVWNIDQEKKAALEFANIEAQAIFNNDLVYHRLVSQHGGLYIPDNQASTTEGCLALVKERDIKSDSVKKLTQINSADIARQVLEISYGQYGYKWHITSLNPVHPENKPDDWEAGALRLFEQGESEVSSLKRINNEEYLRYMKPVLIEKSCLQCHAHQGYKEGSIRGGISVSVPMKDFFLVADAHTRKIAINHSLVYLFLLLVGLFIYRWFLKEMKERHKAQLKLMENEARLHQQNKEYVLLNKDYESQNRNLLQINEALRLQEQTLKEAQKVASLGSYSFDVKSGIWTNSDELDQIFGIDKNFKRDVAGWIQIVHPDYRSEMATYLKENVLTNHEKFNKEYKIINSKNGKEVWVRGLGGLHFDEKGNPVEMFGTIQDITERKLAEDALKQKMIELEKFNMTMINRELKMIELKQEINKLCQDMGVEARYKIPG